MPFRLSPKVYHTDSTICPSAHSHMFSSLIPVKSRAQYSGGLIGLFFEPRVYSFFVTYLTVVHGYKELYEVNSIPPNKRHYPKCIASVVTSGRPHDLIHVVNGFSWDQVQSPHLPLSSSRQYIPYVSAFFMRYMYFVYFQSLRASFALFK